jgi:hypothetical protein
MTGFWQSIDLNIRKAILFWKQKPDGKIAKGLTDVKAFTSAETTAQTLCAQFFHQPSHVASQNPHCIHAFFVVTDVAGM